MGSTLSQGSTFVLGPTPSSDDWATAHRSTLANPLWMIIEYYRRLYGPTVLKVALLQIMELGLPELPVHPDRFTFEDTHEWTGPSYTAFRLDIGALEMLSVDQLVDQIYEDRVIKQDLHGFVTRVPVFCAYYRTPLFQTTQAKYYKMVVAAFEQRPNHADIPWVTTPVIYDVEISTGAPVIAQIATIEDPLAWYCGIANVHHQPTPTTTSIQNKTSSIYTNNSLPSLRTLGNSNRSTYRSLIESRLSCPFHPISFSFFLGTIHLGNGSRRI
jgi:hypothetical protein